MIHTDSSWQQNVNTWRIFLLKGQKSIIVNVQWMKSKSNAKCTVCGYFLTVGREKIYLHWYVVWFLLISFCGWVSDWWHLQESKQPASTCVPEKERAMANLKLVQRRTLGQTSERCTNNLNSEQKPTWETSAIPSQFVLYPLNSEEKHHPPLMCFPSHYWPPLAAPLPFPQKKHSTSQDVRFLGLW